MLPARRHLGALLVVSWAAVVLELAYGRVLAVAVAPYFAGAVIALAAAAYGAGALLVQARARRFPAATLDRQLVAWMAWLGVAAILGEIMFLEHLWLPHGFSARDLALLAATAAVFGAPAFCAGVCSALVIAHGGARLGAVYAARFAGAALGCGVAVALLGAMTAPRVPVVAAAVVAWTAFLVAADAGTSLIAPAAACGFVFLFGMIGVSTPHVFRLLQVKQWPQPYTETEGWEAGARVGVFRPGAGATAAQTLPLARPADAYVAPPPPEFKWLDVDGAAWQPVLRFDGDLAPLAFLRDSVVYAAHHLRPHGAVLLVGAGSGRDVLAARVFGPSRIVALESSALLPALVDDRYGWFSGRPFALPGVEVRAGDVRGALARDAAVYDLVQLGPEVGGPIGGLLPADAYLLTADAVAAYRRHLAPHGLLSITLPLLGEYPFEVLRLLRTIRETWAADGVGDPTAHVIVLTQDFSATVLAQRDPFTAADLAAVDALAAAKRLTVTYDPRRRGGVDDDALRLLGPDGVRTLPEGASFRPATDAHPFFRQFLRVPNKRLASDPLGILADAQNAVRTSWMLVLVTAMLGMVAAVVPAQRNRRGDARGALLAAYALGAGFVLVTLPALQWLALLLGAPARAIAAGGSALFLGAAGGALLAPRVAARRHGPAAAAAIAALAGAGWAALLPPLVSGGLGDTHALALAIVAALPLGAVLGVAHPQPLAALHDGVPDRLAWAYGLDGVARAAGLALVALLASQAGFTLAMLAGAAAYAVAAAALASTRATPAA